MNPSASGWIDKLNRHIVKQQSFANLQWSEFYEALRASGFIYGSNITTVINIPTELTLSEDEITKINLYVSLLFCYFEVKENGTPKTAVKEILNFYKELKARKFSFLDKILIGSESNAQLEKVIDSRVRLNSNFLTQNFSNLITNALLFSDVLAFMHFLKKQKETEAYAILLETRINKVVFQALNSKEQKSDYDELLIKLVESSMRYQKNENGDTILTELSDSGDKSWSARTNQYILDLACMAVWDDAAFDSKEEHFLWSLGSMLQIESNYVKRSLRVIREFIAEHRDKIAFFNNANPVKAFYDQSSKTVSKLILRNKKRLTKELTESGELMILLTRSTIKDLTEEEKQKVKDQLLDICKSIPSLAIFALPGGGILLPLLVKFIPKLLPSAFDDNKIKED